MYGGLGSAYGSNYGGSYGGIGSYGGMSNYGGYTSSMTNFNRPGMSPNNLDPNNPDQQPPNQRRIVMEEYFKMMGGLRSMVELGFSFVALGNFGSKSLKLMKKIFAFLAQTSQKFLEKLSGTSAVTEKMSAIFQKAMLLSPNSKNGNTPLNKALMILRILAAFVVAIGVLLKSKLQYYVKKYHKEIVYQFNEVKLYEERLYMLYMQEHGHQKYGYF